MTPTLDIEAIAQRVEAAIHAAPALRTTYDYVFLADDEWDNETMQRVAQEWFAEHPDCQFVLVYEHAGWELGFRRDMTVWGSANDGARCPGPKPSGFSGISHRRTSKGLPTGEQSSAVLST